MVTELQYAQPKRLFIHSIHRVIHNSTGEKWRNIGVFHGFHRFIHKPYPLCFHMWICLWTCISTNFWLFTFVTKMNNYACSRMFGTFRPPVSGDLRPEMDMAKSYESNENVKSPKNYAKVIHISRFFLGIRTKKEPRRQSATQEKANLYCFLLLPRMVASGLAACFMNAEGLMPTMFLNCLEKW